VLDPVHAEGGEVLPGNAAASGQFEAADAGIVVHAKTELDGLRIPVPQPDAWTWLTACSNSGSTAHTIPSIYKTADVQASMGADTGAGTLG